MRRSIAISSALFFILVMMFCSVLSITNSIEDMKTWPYSDEPHRIYSVSLKETLEAAKYAIEKAGLSILEENKPDSNGPVP